MTGRDEKIDYWEEVIDAMIAADEDYFYGHTISDFREAMEKLNIEQDEINYIEDLLSSRGLEIGMVS